MSVWEILPISALNAFLLGFVFMVVLYFTAGIIIWIAIVVIFAAILAAAYFCHI